MLPTTSRTLNNMFTKTPDSTPKANPHMHIAEGNNISKDGKQGNLFIYLFLLSFIDPFRYITIGYRNCQ
jgi:hypothetical protein